MRVGFCKVRAVALRAGAAGLLAFLLHISATNLAAAVLEPFGLQGRVLSLGVSSSLYAGTFGGGVFVRDLATPQAGWTSIGLAGKRVRAVLPRECGPQGSNVLAGLEGNPIFTDSALVYRAQGNPPIWFEDDLGMSRTNVTTVWSLDGFMGTSGCGATFAASIGPTGGVWRRVSDASPWQVILDIGFGACNVVHIDRASGNIWAGGENAILSPWIARSTNGGTTWDMVHPDMAGDNACDALDVHPQNPDIAYAGMEGAVLRTTDGGKTWEPTGLVGTPAYMYGLALDVASPSHILAGGTVTDPNSWALWESFDAGLTWRVIPAPSVGGPGGETAAGITSLVADPSRAGTFYIATNGHGVWRYRSSTSETPIGPPAARLLLAPAYPNPFNGATTLAFEVPMILDGALVTLVLFDLGGREIRTLVNGRLPAGPHSTRWDGTDSQGRSVASGLYLCRLQAGSEIEARSVMYLK